MKKQTKIIAKLIAGCLCILLGIIMGFLPILQGWIFIMLGVFLLADHVPLFYRLKERLKDRFPKAYDYVLRKKDKWKKKL